MTRIHGAPCWFELSTRGSLDSAETFYARVLGWEFMDAGMQGFTYHLARAGGNMVAGLMTSPPEAGDIPSHWLIYFAVDDADATVAAIRAAGGRIYKEPADIPGTGRFAVAADPRGAAFGILQPEPMPDGTGGNAFDQSKAGHGNWTELMTPDPSTDFDFYTSVFGWDKTQSMEMGEMGTYQMFAHDGQDIGGVMGPGGAPVPNWLTYFGTKGINPAIARITEGGGTVVHGPTPIPGGAFIAVARDPSGAHFALVGPKDAA